MRILVSIFLTSMALLLSSCATADKIKPFSSDGCSLFPDGTLKKKNLWLQCCYAHDVAYWKGGTQKQRSDADKALHQCVSDLDEKEIADVMLAGVRVGGSPYFPTWYRWGYGWSYLRGYKALTEEELEQVKQAEQAKTN